MGKRVSIVLVLITALMLVALSMATSGSAAGRPLFATMTGPEEVPPGDPDGTGSALFTFNPWRGRVCFKLEVADIEPATAAHIHVGEAGVAGSIVIPLVAPTDGSSSGCVHDVDTELITAIKNNPSGYYVNVHNDEFPSGAVRGQLSR